MIDDALRGPRSPRIVELLGAPGSGKSTLAAALLAGPAPRPLAPAAVSGRPRLPLGRTVDRGLRRVPEVLPGRLGRLVRAALWADGADDALATLQRTHPEFLALVAHAPPPADADAEHVLRWRSWPLATLEAHVLLRRADAPGETVLVEEGLVMRANTVCAGDATLAVRYFATQPLPDVVVLLDVAPEVALQRVRARPKRTLRRHAGRDDAAVLADLERSVRLFSEAVPALEARGVPVHVVDATEPVPILRRRVVDLLAAPGSATGA